jgi:hypothetical protein
MYQTGPVPNGADGREAGQTFRTLRAGVKATSGPPPSGRDPGTKRRRFLEENTASVDVILTDGDLAAIAEAAPGAAPPAIGTRTCPKWAAEAEPMKSNRPWQRNFQCLA